MGLAQPIEPAYGPRPEATSPTVVVVAAPGFPDHDLIRSEIRRGVAALPQATWVVPFGPRQRNGELTGLGVIRETLEALDVDYLVAVKCKDFELAACATKVVVFHDGRPQATTAWYTDRAEQPWGKNITAVVRRPLPAAA